MPSDATLTSKERLAWLAIQDNAAFAQSLVAGMTPQDFAADRRTFYAVTRCLEIISEAARRLRGAQQDRFPDLEWRQIEDSGNVFRHVYQSVDESRVLMTVQDRVPALLSAANIALDGEPPRNHQPR
jgi:uncharacterized protein with HEPN domain